MKKIIGIIIALTFALAYVTAVLSVTYATDNHIPGFVENMDGLFLRNQQAELKQVMQKNLGEFFEGRFYTSYLPGLKAMGKTNGLTDQELYDLYMAQVDVNYDLGFKYYGLHTNHYIAQYVADGSFEYLIDDSAYIWLAPTTGKILSGIPFYSDGTIVERVPSGLSLFLDEEILNFLFDYDKIEKQLQDVGETRVNDIKIITQPLSMLYINGGKDDYLIRLERYAPDFKREQTFAGNVDRFEIFTVKEMMDKLVVFPEPIQYYDGSISINAEMYISRELLATKPTYETEGEALMAEGIIQGNEKGLDPLKPLTRIEATTILVRALGYENEPTAAESKFADIPNGDWGVKYANIAADKRLTKGVGDNKFAPNELVTDNQFATMLLRTTDIGEFDWTQAIQMLIDKGIITAEDAKTMDLFTRGDMAKIIYEARAKGLL